MASFGQVVPSSLDRRAKALVPPVAPPPWEPRKGADPTASKPSGTARSWLTLEPSKAWAFTVCQELPLSEVSTATELGALARLWPGLEVSTVMTRVPLSAMRSVGTAWGNGLPKIPVALGWCQRPSWSTRT